MRIGDFGGADSLNVTKLSKNEKPERNEKTDRSSGRPKVGKEPPSLGVLVRVGDVATMVSEASRKPAVPDPDRVARILSQIQEGKYKIDFEHLAEKMLDEEVIRGKRHS